MLAKHYITSVTNVSAISVQEHYQQQTPCANPLVGVLLCAPQMAMSQLSTSCQHIREMAM